MIHGDDRGLVLPPKIAPIQVVIVPIHTKQGFSDEINKLAQEIMKRLDGTSLSAIWFIYLFLGYGFRVRIDDRNTVQPGFKFSHWELKV
jgi:prolyl-tRNA synthetase